MARLLTSVVLVVVLVSLWGRASWANSELRPAARLVFPYFDIRPGTTTILFLTNVGDEPVAAQLTFYDRTCSRTSRSLGLTAKDVAVIDLSSLLGDFATEASREGFVDVRIGPNALIGAATILNLTEDWAISYHPAAARRLSGPDPFELFPSRLALPGFFTPADGPRRLDGFLVLVAPNPRVPGGFVPEEAVRAAFDVFSSPSPSFPSGLSISLSATGHQLILPLSAFAGGLPAGSMGWLSVANGALDEEEEPLGLVGLFVQTSVDPAGGGGMAGAVRLWGLP